MSFNRIVVFCQDLVCQDLWCSNGQPLLFNVYASRLFDSMNRDLPNVHCYPDDSQLYLSFSPKSLANQDAAIIAMECFIKDVKNWMCSDKLKLNNGKTEIIIIGTRPQLSKVKINHIRVGACDIKPTTLWRTLGPWFDEKIYHGDSYYQDLWCGFLSTS